MRPCAWIWRIQGYITVKCKGVFSSAKLLYPLWGPPRLLLSGHLTTSVSGVED